MLKMFKSEKGFTLYEIIAILVVIGILAVIAVSRKTNWDVEVYTGTDTLKTHLRYAQNLAMNSNPNTGDATIWGISCDGNNYWLFSGNNSANTGSYHRLPDEDAYINNDRTINLSAKKIAVSQFTIFFDNRGIPYSPNSATKLLNSLSISVTPIGGGSGLTLNITPFTGYIP
jgi:Tfp pilus assembly protein FimT